LDSKHTEPEEHWTAERVWASRNDCSDGKCKPEIAKLARFWRENERKEREKEPYLCKGCGLGVTKEEGENPNINCPLCGNKEARKR
jgi:transcription initiation factor IIE alpha subunit